MTITPETLVVHNCKENLEWTEIKDGLEWGYCSICGESDYRFFDTGCGG